MNDFLKELVMGWSVDELNRYIDLMQSRAHETEELIKELKVIRRKKRKSTTPDNGTRGGM